MRSNTENKAGLCRNRVNTVTGHLDCACSPGVSTVGTDSLFFLLHVNLNLLFLFQNKQMEVIRMKL